MHPHDTPSVPNSKRCSVCKEIKPLSEFYIDRVKRDGRGSTCKPCARHRSKQWIANNREQARQRARRYYEEHAEEIKEYVRQYYRENRDAIRIRAKEYAKTHAQEFREYRRKNRSHRKLIFQNWYQKKQGYARSPKRKQYLREWMPKRRARLAALPHNFIESDQIHALSYFEGRCAICEKPPGLFHSLIFDHWIAIMDDSCPGTIPTNMVPICNGLNGCNQKKSDMRPDEWLELEYGKEQAAKILARINDFFETVRQT